MSRRANAKPAGVQMFPFLAVLICTMGALVVLLHAFARHGQLQAIKTAEAKAPRPALDVKDVQWRIDHIRAARDKTQSQLADERLKLAHVEDHARRLQDKLKRLQSAATEIERTSTAQDDQSRGRAAELAATKAELEKAQAALDEARKKGGGGKVNYSVVPYDGLNATQRRPIYIECREDSIVLQPEGIELTPRDFAGYFGPSNPLAAAVRAQREYFARSSPDGELQDEPYPLLLVRPDGVMTYNAARRALISWGSDFGYELIGADWELKFGEPDPQLAKLMQKIVGEARVRNREYTLSSPNAARRRSRPVYRARPHGGFAAEGGDGFGRSSGGSVWDGSGGAGRGRDGDAWTHGDNFAAGDNPYASPERRGAGTRDGSSASGDPYGSAESRDLHSSADGSTRGGRSGASGGRNVRSSGGGATSGNQERADKRDGDRPAGEDAESTGPYGIARTDTAGDQQSGAEFGEPNGRQADLPGMPGGTQSDAQASNGGSPGASGDSQSSGECATCDSPSQAPQAIGTPPPAVPHGSTTRKPQRIAATRGRDWGLPASAGRSVAATRPIRVLCYSDRLVIVPPSQGQAPREIPLGSRTRDSMDELVSGVWDHMKSWGTAGRKLYWRPLLSIDVQPGGADRYADIRALLADSGIAVEQRQPRRPVPPQRSRTTRSRPIR